MDGPTALEQVETLIAEAEVACRPLRAIRVTELAVPGSIVTMPDPGASLPDFGPHFGPGERMGAKDLLMLVHPYDWNQILAALPKVPADSQLVQLFGTPIRHG